jgi:1-acyl-sn-glycerol-3-phosphate acyltransferase
MISREDLERKLKASLVIARASGATLLTGGRMVRAFSTGQGDPSSPEIRADVRLWGRRLCDAFNVRITLQGEELDTGPGILVSNHMSYLDIPMLCALNPMSFVAKAEVKDWPIIGAAAGGFGVIYIDRSSKRSRHETGDHIRKAVEEKGQRVVVFPEGTTSLKGLPWRAGVFKLAQEHKIPMQAMTICYRPAKYAAFETDSMMEHLMTLPDAGPIEAVLSVGPRFEVTDFLKDFERCETWNKKVLAEELSRQGLL